jgi:hypothetical protein
MVFSNNDGPQMFQIILAYQQNKNYKYQILKYIIYFDVRCGLITFRGGLNLPKFSTITAYAVRTYFSRRRFRFFYRPTTTTGLLL